MSRPVPFPFPSQKTHFGTSREREFYKYLPPHHLNAHALQHVGRDSRSTEFVARSSSDITLTAFAQLGTWRLDAQRALISLFGRHEQHIITEATRTLSLQDTTDNNVCAELWVGTCTMSYDRSFCKSVSNPPQSAQTPGDRVFVVSDLTQDDDFKDHPDVTGGPNIRFLACCPIISPKGIVIGSYTVLDNKPHGPLSTNLVKFLTDIATTVMDYFDSTRSKVQHLRGERMVVGLGSFLEGKGSLRNAWLNVTEDPRPISQDDDHVEGHINQEQQEKQVSDSLAQAMTESSAASGLALRPHNFHTTPEQKSYAHGRQSLLLPSSKTSKRDHAKAQSRNQHASEATLAFSNEGLRQQSPKEIYTAEVKETFSRAANLVRESAEVEAVVFFDANFGSREAFVNNTKSDYESSSLESCSSSGEESKARKAFAQHDRSTAEAEIPNKVTNPCEIHGFATSNASSINNQATGDSKIAMSEGFLGGLLRRYPQGKIFNFGEDGSISSDDTSDGVFKNLTRRSGGKKYKRTRRAILRQDAAALLQLAPDSRSIVFSPLWDSYKGKWHSGALAWTRSPHRVFTSDGELAFLFAFGNSIMAEVHQLSAQFAERAKSDLLAGLSHELRSPLHGVFGTAELLNDTVMDALQRGFVHTISSCAFTLLGSINQLLEYASINDARPNSSTAKRPGGLGHKSPTDRTFARARQDSQPEKVGTDSYVELDVVMEDTIESVFAGYSFFNNSHSPLRGVASSASYGDRPVDMQGGVKVILDVDHARNWKFLTRPGALHVVLTNVFGNALKFTQRGYVYVSLKAIPVTFGEDGEAARSTVTVTVRDTGSGIEPDFLRNELWDPFSQEDSMTTGNGLGFNVTRRAVSLLGGDIQVGSQKDVGTEVATTMTLDHASEPVSGLDTPDGAVSSPVAVTEDLVREKTIGILGLGSSDLDVTLGSSLQKLCKDWLGMDVRLATPSYAQFDHCDFYISSHEFLDIGNMELKRIAPGPSQRLASPIIIICSSPRIAHSMFVAARGRGERDVLEFISQPCGPRKLAKTLEICTKRQKRRIDWTNDRAGMHAGALIPPTPDEFDREPFFSAPNPGISAQPKSEDTATSAPIYSQGPTVPPGHLKPPGEEAGHSRVSTNSALSDTGEQSPTTKSECTQPQQTSRKTVLLVDDNDLNLRILIAFMKKLGCAYAIAQNGQEALEAFKANAASISIILMDISMPVMDGLESTRQIRKFEGKYISISKTPVRIVALTGLAQADVESDASRSGMDLFLTKPVRMDGLVPIVKDIS